MSTPIARAAVRDESLKREILHQSKPRNPALLWLDKNENLDPVLNQITGKILRDIDPLRTLAVYPDCVPLYLKLADYLHVSIDRLILSTGSDGVIRSAFEAFCDPGDAVLFPNPTYAMYEVYGRIYGTRLIKIDYQPSESGPVLEATALVEAIRVSRPKLVCLPNPGSPTGTVYAPDELAQIIVAATESGALILVDEAYYPYYDQTAISWIDRFPNLLVVRTFSKAWGMTGLRVGYGVGSPGIIALLHKVRPNYETNSIGVVVTERMLDFGAEMEASVRRLNAGRDFFLNEMQLMGFKTFPANASFLHVNFGMHADDIHFALADKVLYREDFGHSCLKGYSRLSSTTRELFSPLVDCIKSVVVREEAM
jgi:histidinol-phosphate aminotransferase